MKFSPQYKANLDELAGSLISEVNALHTAGYTLAGATGMDFFSDFLISPEVPNASDYEGAAAYIALSSDVRDTPENISAGSRPGPREITKRPWRFWLSKQMRPPRFGNGPMPTEGKRFPAACRPRR